jgi:hypothetical protein
MQLLFVRVTSHIYAVYSKGEHLINSRRDIANFTIYFCAVSINSLDISRAFARDWKFKIKRLMTNFHRKNPTTRAYIYSSWNNSNIINGNLATASIA